MSPVGTADSLQRLYQTEAHTAQVDLHRKTADSEPYTLSSSSCMRLPVGKRAHRWHPCLEERVSLSLCGEELEHIGRSIIKTVCVERKQCAGPEQEWRL